MSENTAVKAKLIKAKSRPTSSSSTTAPSTPLRTHPPGDPVRAGREQEAPQPRKDVQEQWHRELGASLVDKFYQLVVPETFKGVLDLEDIDQVFEVWAEHVGLGESKGSGN